MTQKRFRKLLMGRRCDRNWTHDAARVARESGASYAQFWDALTDMCRKVWPT